MAGLTHRVVLITVGLVVMVALHLVVVIWALFRARPSRRVAEHAEESGGGGAGLSVEEVSELPCHEFKEEKPSAADEFPVCLEAFRAGARCRVLPRCGHGFHAECVDSWLLKSRRCPVCRAEAVQRRKGAGAVAEVAAATTVDRC
ncbi:unnamed protein product [Urochloa humidicola]